MKPTVALIIMDGFGENPDTYGNAVKTASTPNLDRLAKEGKTGFLNTSGMSVGLPDGQMGNSEVGHTNIGAGRIVYQELTRISKSIKDGEFSKNQALTSAVENCKKNNSSFHIMGLASDGGVHSHNTHIYALVQLAKDAGLEKVYIHCFMDGRDVPPISGKSYIEELENKLEEIGIGQISTIMGRYYAMDRDNRFDRVKLAYDAMVHGEGVKNNSPVNVMEKSYEQNVTDEFVLPAVCVNNGSIKDGDSVVFANFRPDRAREITRTIVDDNFDGFDRQGSRPDVFFVTMTQYDVTIPNVNVAFSPQSLENTFGEIVSKNGKTQLRIAETEKYAHVTFFFNGGLEKPYNGEDRALINSPKVATYDLQPEMSAYLVKDECLKRIESDKYDVIILNFANCDMVGHTGVMDAAVKAVATVDECVGAITDAIVAKGGTVFITADHGNAEKMMEPDGSPFTAHTTFPVLYIISGLKDGLRIKSEGALCDIAPTLLDIMGISKPAEMSGDSLILR